MGSELISVCMPIPVLCIISDGLMQSLFNTGAATNREKIQLFRRLPPELMVRACGIVATLEVVVRPYAAAVLCLAFRMLRKSDFFRIYGNFSFRDVD